MTYILQTAERQTVDFPGGAQIHLAPVSPRIIAAGRQASRQARDDDPGISPQLAMIAFSEGVLAAAITGWSGFGLSETEPLECTPANVRIALGDVGVFDRLDAEYVVPILMREAEKNVSAASSNGTSTEATAANDIANSPAASGKAKPKPKSPAKPKATARKRPAKPSR